ncbi:MAG: prepilin-type N-terminal cleavage/methylation domain-containing protein [Pseudomonadota bacterium]
MKRAIDLGLVPGEEGFTLLEIMVSLAIIAIVFVSVFRLQAGSINLADSGNFHTLAPYLARIILSTPDADLADATVLSGKFDKQYQDWSWRLTLHDLEPIEGEALPRQAAEHLKRLDVEITKGNQTLSVSTWRYIARD